MRNLRFTGCKLLTEFFVICRIIAKNIKLFFILSKRNKYYAARKILPVFKSDP